MTVQMEGEGRANGEGQLKERGPLKDRVRLKVVVLLGVLIVLGLAGVVSFHASGSPDGLERVAEDHGFGHTAEDSATGDSPLADYATRGVDNPRLSGGIAGVAGVVVVLGLGTGIAYALRRRARDRRESAD
ncbi:PDGLE domain-containing protein [Actinopolymorpha alba]|uniref:PDGLE domain-containing protein n=1 Tax=Actinopolymorpha alba TaxID=533267 RepID=UPI0003635A17|nr:PDGLE domain-containing protein [Actinopolymorpha alba]